MDRFAVFVDAGYLYAEGAKLCCRATSRNRFTVDAEKLNTMLCELSRGRCGLGYLRTYWYDGARSGVRTLAQQEIAALPNVKLRLGRVNARGQQKGVDALIYRDLMTLAHERAISEAFLLSGDEDLREGVKAAQDRGVRVTLIGVAPGPGKRNQSQELVYETDEVVVLTRKELSPYFALVAQPPPEMVGSVDLPAVGERFTNRWLQSANNDEIRTVIQSRPAIPRLIDIELIHAGECALGASLRSNHEARHALRESFWSTVSKHTSREQD